MSTKTVQFRFDVSGTLTDVTSVVLRDVTATFGLRRTDTLAVIVPAGTALTRLSVGLYALTFTEPAAGLNYEYVIEYVYGGNTRRLRQVLETTLGGGTPAPAPSTYQQMGIDTVACGDATLSAYLTAQANLVWAMQVRRGVALDLTYQYYVSDLITYALDHVRMMIDTELGSNLMNDRATMDALNNSTAHATTTRTRTSSFTESSSSSQSFARAATRSASSSSRLDASNSARRDASSSDYSTMSQSTSGSSSHSQSGSTVTTGNLAADGTSGKATSMSTTGTKNTTKHRLVPFGAWVSSLAGIGNPTSDTPDLTSSLVSVSGSIAGLVSASFMVGNSGVSNRMKTETLGLVNYNGTLDAGDPSDFSLVTRSSSDHARKTTGSQTGSASSILTSSGSRQNNRSASSVAASDSSTLGNASSTMASSSSDSQTRAASSTSHSESAFHSTMTASSTLHREMAGADNMSNVGAIDREYYSQIFESLKQMFEDTQEIIRKLEAQMLLVSQYLISKLTTVTPHNNLVGVAAAYTDRTLIQRPGVRNQSIYIPYDPWVVR
jgi:hypothetical protein